MPPFKHPRKFGWVLERQAACRIVERVERGPDHVYAQTIVGRVLERAPFGVDDCKEVQGKFVFYLKPNLTVEDMLVVCKFMGKESGAPVDVSAY